MASCPFAGLARAERIASHIVPAGLSASNAAATEAKGTVFDVIIIGGGVAGSATCYELSKRGKKVLMLEQYHECHSRSSSHGDGRIIRYAYPEDIYLKMSDISYKGWKELEARSGDKVLTICGGIDIADEKHEKHLSELEVNYTKNGCQFEKLTADEASKRFPVYSIPKGNKVVFQPQYGVVWANKAVSAFWRCAREQGAVILSNSPVTDVMVESAEKVRVQTGTGDWYEGKSVVITAGPYTRELVAKSLGLQLDLVPSQEMVMYFPPKQGAPVSHMAGSMPVLIDHNKLKIYLLPQMDIPGVKVAMHHDPSAPLGLHPDTRAPFNLEKIKQVSAWVKKHLPHLEPTPFHVQSCIYTNTRDLHFMLDRHPKYSNVVIGSACSGHGFKFGPVLGQILSSLVLQEAPPVPLDMFSITAKRELRRTGA